MLRELNGEPNILNKIRNNDTDIQYVAKVSQQNGDIQCMHSQAHISSSIYKSLSLSLHIYIYTYIYIYVYTTATN